MLYIFIYLCFYVFLYVKQKNVSCETFLKNKKSSHHKNIFYFCKT